MHIGVVAAGVFVGAAVGIVEGVGNFFVVVIIVVVVVVVVVIVVVVVVVVVVIVVFIFFSHLALARTNSLHINLLTCV